MYLLVGLGNPGAKYKNKRHNVGHMVIYMITKKYKLKITNLKKFGIISKGKILKDEIITLKTKEFMNLSGLSIKKFMNFYKIDLKKLLVFHDDLDLPLGKIKIKIGGGIAGHNGLKNIDEIVGINYKRIRIGIDRPENNKNINKFVLENFKKEEEKEIYFSINRIISFLQYFLSSDNNDISILMNKLSKK